MSIWYQHDIKVLGDRKAIGRFFNLDPEKDIHYIDTFEFSFGQKNAPGLRLGKLIEQSPDLIFLVKSSTDYNSYLSLQRFNENQIDDGFQNILIMSTNYDPINVQVSKLLYEEYSKRFPYLLDQHKTGRPMEWKLFFNDYQKAIDILNHTDDYKEMIAPFPLGEPDLEFDNMAVE